MLKKGLFVLFKVAILVFLTAWGGMLSAIIFSSSTRMLNYSSDFDVIVGVLGVCTSIILFAGLMFLLTVLGIRMFEEDDVKCVS